MADVIVRATVIARRFSAVAIQGRLTPRSIFNPGLLRYARNDGGSFAAYSAATLLGFVPAL